MDIKNYSKIGDWADYIVGIVKGIDNLRALNILWLFLC